MKCRAVIFDLDGTLLDTLDDLAGAMNYVLVKYGYERRSMDEVRSFVGNGIAKLVERAVPGGCGNPVYGEALTSFKEYYAVHCNDMTHAYEGIAELISQLRADGIKVAIVSNKVDSAVRELRDIYFIDSIDVAVGDREGLRKKPCPDMVELAMSELGCVADETVYVGDSDVDIDTAANCGLRCISVSWGFRNREFLEEHGAGMIADSPAEVYELISKLKR